MARKTNASKNSTSNPGSSGSERETQRSRSSPNGRSGSHRGASAGGPRRTSTQARRSPGQQEQQRTSSRPQQRRSSQSGNVFFDTGSAVVDTVRQHPIPAALIGAGLAWMLLETRAARDVENRLLEQARNAAGKVGETFSELAETAREAYSDASESTQERLSSAAESVKDGAAAFAEYAQSGAASVGTALQSSARAVGDTAYTGYERSRDALADAWEQHPLAVATSLLVAGVATGLLMPASVREGRLIGAAAANVTEKVRTKSSELIEQGKELVSSSTNALTREARRFGIGAGGGSSGGRRSSKKR